MVKASNKNTRNKMIAIMATDIAFIHSNTIDFVFVFNSCKDAKKINPLLAVSIRCVVDDSIG